jgi:hypothetical protein
MPFMGKTVRRIGPLIRIFLFFILLTGWEGVSMAQVMVSPTGKPASLIICHDDGTFPC